MKAIWILALLSAACVAIAKKSRPTDDSTDDTTDDSTDVSTDEIATTVIALIDAGTCGSIVTSTNCGDDATGYYETFAYNDTHRVIIVSGAPDHQAETELFMGDDGEFNPNSRCERWQYSVVPLNPVKSTTTNWSNYTTYPYYGMGAYGYATSGGTFFDTRSSADSPGETAWDNEIDSLDICMGHSNNAYQYHYHGVPYCMPHDDETDTDLWLANNSSVCQFVGYMLDGFPVYGRCQHTDGTELESCWTNTTTTPNDLSDYSYDSTDCNLDEANGYTFAEGNTQTSDSYAGYAYVTTTEFSGVPIGFMGDTFGSICGFGDAA
jgi:hypothetical protein